MLEKNRIVGLVNDALKNGTGKSYNALFSNCSSAAARVIKNASELPTGGIKKHFPKSLSKLLKKHSIKIEILPDGRDLKEQALSKYKTQYSRAFKSSLGKTLFRAQLFSRFTEDRLQAYADLVSRGGKNSLYRALLNTETSDRKTLIEDRLDEQKTGVLSYKVPKGQKLSKIYIKGSKLWIKLSDSVKGPVHRNTYDSDTSFKSWKLSQYDLQKNRSNRWKIGTHYESASKKLYFWINPSLGIDPK